MLKEFRADLHIHSCLSPCGDKEMTPRAIVNQAQDKGLDIIAICDHNSAENVMATQKAAKDKNLKVLAGMEVTSQEEVHLLALFDQGERALNLQEKVYGSLLEGENQEEIWGIQLIVDEEDVITGVNKRLLIGATKLSISPLVETIHSLGGLAIASHIDREAFSIVGQLGFVPVDLPLDGLELSPRFNYAQRRNSFSLPAGFALVTFSDAHCLADLGKVSTKFLLAEATVGEIRKALFNQEERRVTI